MYWPICQNSLLIDGAIYTYKHILMILLYLSFITLTDSCACGMDDTCIQPGTKCNCDINDDQLHEDSGFITEMIDLPITQFLAGDTGKLFCSITQEFGLA